MTQNKLVLSVAVPIQRFVPLWRADGLDRGRRHRRYSARGTRARYIGSFLWRFAVMLVSSLYLSRFIARAGAPAGRRRGPGAQRSRGPRDIPRWTTAMTRSAIWPTPLGMTRALYDRIDAIESFAADVAHELKNPLTSLKSAVEMLVRAPRTMPRARS